MVLHSSCSGFKMATGWSSEKTKALIEIWGEEEIQRALDRVARNEVVYQKVATALRTLGHSKNWQQCRTKMENLIQRYKKVCTTVKTYIIYK